MKRENKTSYWTLVETDSLQFNESAIEDSAETAYEGHELQSSYWIDSIRTYGGETSGIITKGIGPRPMANDLDRRECTRLYEVFKSIHYECECRNTRKSCKPRVEPVANSNEGYNGTES